MIVVQSASDTAHAASKVREMETAEVRLWKKELEFSRSMDTAWHEVMVVLERKASKKAAQLSVVKFVPTSVSNARGIVHGGAVGEGEEGVDVPEVVVEPELDAVDDLVDLCTRLGGVSDRSVRGRACRRTSAYDACSTRACDGCPGSTMAVSIERGVWVCVSERRVRCCTASLPTQGRADTTPGDRKMMQMRTVRAYLVNVLTVGPIGCRLNECDRR